MHDPYAILGVPPEADNELIRKRYLELVREFPPEQHPQKFAEIRSAYEKLRDLDRRVQYRLFEQGKDESLEAIIEELACRTPRTRFTLQQLLSSIKRT